jgi:acyl carrier protein
MRPSNQADLSQAARPLSAATGGGHDEREQRLLEILLRISGADPAAITPEARLIEDIGIDSLGFYEILIEADECLGIKIPEEQLLKFRTVGDIQNYLHDLGTPDAQAT